MTQIDTDKLLGLDEKARQGDIRAAREIRDHLFDSRAAILAMAEDNRRLREALERCAQIVARHNYRQNEKVDDVVLIARQALAVPGEQL